MAADAPRRVRRRRPRRPRGRRGPSRLSPYLHFGCVSARMLAVRARALGGEAFTRQLCWRDFYAHILLSFARPARRDASGLAAARWVDDPTCSPPGRGAHRLSARRRGHAPAAPRAGGCTTARAWSRRRSCEGSRRSTGVRGRGISSTCRRTATWRRTLGQLQRVAGNGVASCRPEPQSRTRPRSCSKLDPERKGHAPERGTSVARQLADVPARRTSPSLGLAAPPRRWRADRRPCEGGRAGFPGASRACNEKTSLQRCTLHGDGERCVELRGLGRRLRPTICLTRAGSALLGLLLPRSWPLTATQVQRPWGAGAEPGSFARATAGGPASRQARSRVRGRRPVRTGTPAGPLAWCLLPLRSRPQLARHRADTAVRHRGGGVRAPRRGAAVCPTRALDRCAAVGAGGVAVLGVVRRRAPVPHRS